MQGGGGGKEEATETISETAQMSEVTDLKAAVINTFREVKGIMLKDVRDMMTMFHQKETINKINKI